MKMKLIGLIGVAGVMAGLGASPTMKPVQRVTGDYVEVRTASVFAGACHYNGELVTTGHEAIMAWSIAAGSWKGTDLSGVRAMGAVVSDASLGDANGSRQCELVIDPSASGAQAAAFTEMVREKSGAALGSVMSVRRGAVAFADKEGAYTVKAEGFGEMAVQPMPDMACCKQPNLVWYSPLMTLTNRKVGFAENAVYAAGTLGDPWQRAGENDAFYGQFAW